MSDLNENAAGVVPPIADLPEEHVVRSVGKGARPSRDQGDDRAKDREAAFDAEFAWRGAPLHPFSIDRESLFSEVRLANGAPPIVKTSADFDGFLADALRILFICSHTKDDFRPLRRDPIAFQEAIDAWAVENVARGEQSAAITLGIEIYVSSFATEHEPVPSEKRDEPGN